MSRERCAQCMNCAVCGVQPFSVNRCTCLSMKTCGARKSTRNCTASESNMPKFTRSAHHSKTSSSRSLRNTLPNNESKKQHDTFCHSERSEESHNCNERFLKSAEDRQRDDARVLRESL